MKRYFCEKCNGILPKGKIVCDKCGYENPELIPVLREHIKRQILIRRITKIAVVVVFLIILHINFLLPWQWQTFNNKMTMLSYIKENYPGAKIISQHYESAEFRPGRSPIDTIKIEWSNINFSIRAEDGKVIVDSYWDGVASKTIYEAFLDPYFSSGNINIDYEIYSPKLAIFLQDNPNSDITHFDGWGTRIIIRPQHQKGKNTPKDLGWLYDFYCYCKENVSLSSYTITLIYPPVEKGDYFIHLNQDSNYYNAEEFYSAFLLDK